MIEFAIGMVVGGVIIGVMANRRPHWFAKVVSVANVVDAKVNEIAGKI